MPGVVVGVDGSPSSVAALRWALGEARCHGGLVRAVIAWSFPFTEGEIAQQAVLVACEPLERAAHEQLDAAVKAAGDAPEGVAVQREVVHGGPVRVLLDAAEDADLLVVGSRGRGGFAGLLLGSVSQQCVQHADCPVVVVHDRPSRRL